MAALIGVSSTAPYPIFNSSASSNRSANNTAVITDVIAASSSSSRSSTVSVTNSSDRFDASLNRLSSSFFLQSNVFIQQLTELNHVSNIMLIHSFPYSQQQTRNLENLPTETAPLLTSTIASASANSSSSSASVTTGSLRRSINVSSEDPTQMLTKKLNRSAYILNSASIYLAELSCFISKVNNLEATKKQILQEVNSDMVKIEKNLVQEESNLLYSSTWHIKQFLNNIVDTWNLISAQEPTNKKLRTSTSTLKDPLEENIQDTIWVIMNRILNRMLQVLADTLSMHDKFRNFRLKISEFKNNKKQSPQNVNLDNIIKKALVEETLQLLRTHQELSKQSTKQHTDIQSIQFLAKELFSISLDQRCVDLLSSSKPPSSIVGTPNVTPLELRVIPSVTTRNRTFVKAKRKDPLNGSANGSTASSTTSPVPTISLPSIVTTSESSFSIISTVNHLLSLKTLPIVTTSRPSFDITSTVNLLLDLKTLPKAGH